MSDHTVLRPSPTQALHTPYKLTEREFAVARHLASGLANCDIGAHLGLAVRTVAGYRMQVMRKVGARNGAHLSLILSSLREVRAGDMAQPA